MIARLGLLLVARNAAGTATEFLSQSMRSRAAVTIGALPLGVIAETASGSFETICSTMSRPSASTSRGRWWISSARGRCCSPQRSCCWRAIGVTRQRRLR